MPFHLLFPLFSSVCFVFGMMLAKQAFTKGVTPWTGTFLGNLWLAIVWAGVWLVRGRIIPFEAWPDAALIGIMFVFGQLFTYLAFQFGDVSVATPIFGVKVLMVAGLTAIMTGTSVSVNVWMAGAMATAGVVLIQWSARGDHSKPKDIWLTIAMALGAAFSLSLFDVCLQEWASDYSGLDFLPIMFGTAGIASVVFLPWTTSIKQIRELQAGRWILAGTLLMALQAMSMCFCLAQFGDAARTNIVYALRGLWGVLLAWIFAKSLGTREANVGRNAMIRRLIGAAMLTGAVIIAITD